MKNTKLWNAAAMVGDDLLAEAENYTPVKRNRPVRRFAALAVAAVMAVSCLGWAAKEWIFAPGVGLADGEILTRVNVYTNENQIPLGKIHLEAVTFTEHKTDPAENRLIFWVFRSPVHEMGGGAMDPEGKGWLEGDSFTAEVNGVPYRSAGSGYSTAGWGCYTFRPVEDQPVPEPVGENCVITVSYEEPDMTVDPVQVILTPANPAEAEQTMVTGKAALTLLPLSDNLVIGNFDYAEWLPLVETARNTSTHAAFKTITNDGTEGFAFGSLNLCGIQTDYDCVRAANDFYNRGIREMDLYLLNVSMAFHGETGTYTFPLMEIGQTHVPERDVYLLDIGGFTCRLVSVARDEKGLQYETEYRYNGRDAHVNPTYIELNEYSVGPIDYWNGQMHIVNAEAPRNIMNGENSTLVYFTGEETDHVMEVGEEVTVYLQNMMFTYGESYHTEGAKPLAEVTFD
ncbi:MAG: hypothetical protein E7631_10575 [Ruminococcaceae bacterium]|nr:hypothetical protein [Oscillospiraceae bacterium]